eukprot:Skav220510  [mRNA]  locus=scaffold279:10744:10944:- [translate_table: standard]
MVLFFGTPKSRLPRDTFQLEYRIAWNPDAKKQIDERGETGGPGLAVMGAHHGKPNFECQDLLESDD